MVLDKPLVRRFRVSKARSKGHKRTHAKAHCEALQLLILTQFFPPDFAATGQLVDELATQLGQQGLAVNVFTGQPGYAFAEGEAPAKEQNGNVAVRRSRVSQLFANRIRGKAINGVLYTLRAIVHLARNFRRYNVLLVTTAPPFLSVIAYMANLFFRLPYVCLLYDLYPDIAVELEVVRGNHPIAKLWRSLNRKIWRRSAGIIVLSDSMRDRIKGHCVEHCPEVADKISVIHSWSDDEKIVPIAKADNWFAKEHDLVAPFVVMYSGNMGRCHDVETIFQAACKLKDEPILFVCIGGGAKRAALIDAVNSAELTNFRFLPYQEKAVLPYSLTAGDVSLVSIADGMESLVAPSKLYPAMATGRPIAAICPSGSYLRALLREAEGGCAFDNGDAEGLADYIRYLARDRKALQRVGAAGRSHMQAHFTPQIISRRYANVLSQAYQYAKVSKKQ